MSWEGTGDHRTPPSGGTPERKENHAPRKRTYAPRPARNSADAIDREVTRTQDKALEAIEQDARVIKAARKLPVNGPLSQQQINEARTNALDYIERHELTHKQVSRGIGLKSPSTVTEVLNGTYKGKPDAIIRKINAWVEQHARGQDSDRPQLFVSTKVVEQIFKIIRNTIRTRKTAVIFGPAGVSKTTVCLEAARTEIVGSVHIPCNATCTSLTSFSKLWCKCLGTSTGGSNGDRFDRIVEVLKDSDRCQLIDDAHKLLPSRSRDIRVSTSYCKSLEFIFDVHDAAGVPIVLFGTIEIDQAIGDEQGWAGQLSSRVKSRYSITQSAQQSGRPLFTKDDVIAFAKSIGPTFRLTGGAADLLASLCSIPGNGGLRRVENILSTAHDCMRHRRRTEGHDKLGPITIDDIETALHLLYDMAHAEHMLAEADQLKREVA
ncbi:MAG: AAA family ATPase [bacterium]|nr:AAA family ATPase [bacterium]